MGICFSKDSNTTNFDLFDYLVMIMAIRYKIPADVVAVWLSYRTTNKDCISKRNNKMRFWDADKMDYYERPANLLEIFGLSPYSCEGFWGRDTFNYSVLTQIVWCYSFFNILRAVFELFSFYKIHVTSQKRRTARKSRRLKSKNVRSKK